MLDFRPATIGDMELYFRWTQEPGVRDFSFNLAPISYDEHVSWFKRKVDSAHCLMLVAEKNEIPCGQIRFDFDGERATISFSLAFDFRGRGYAKVLLVEGARLCREHFGPEIEIHGIVIRENQASVRAFTQASYQVSEEFQQNGFWCYRFEAPSTLKRENSNSIKAGMHQD